jgi:flagellar hook-associated protein 3 FlgL
MASNTTGWDAFEQAINTTRTTLTPTAASKTDSVVSLSSGVVTNSATYDSSFIAGQPYTISFESGSQIKILDKDLQDVTADATAAGGFSSGSAANQTIGFRGLELTLNVNLTDADKASTATIDAAVSGHSFTLAASSASVTTARLPANSAATVITGSTVTDPAAFSEAFPSGGAVLRFTGTSTFALYAAPYDPASTPVSTGTLAGDKATASGVTFTFSLVPPATSPDVAAGDQFTVQSTNQQTQNVLNTLTSVINALNGKVDGDPVAKQKLQATLDSTIGNLKSALNQVSTAVGDGGARAATATSQGVTNQSQIDNASTESSSITASDPVDAIARLTLQKTMLQASQLVFTQLSSLNLFSKL